MVNDAEIIKPNNVDTVFSWESEVDYKPNKCRIRIYWVTWEKVVVVATDMTNNPGRKIANVTKELLSFINHIYDLVPCKIMLVEHYSANNSFQEDSYLQVLLVNDEAIRYQIDQNRLMKLTEKSIVRIQIKDQKKASNYSSLNHTVTKSIKLLI